jgi:glyoxylase-like metal-dependent hydrolase (beta-lactamase superfamily II)
MEIIVNKHGKGKLATKTCFSDEFGFNVASVIVMGKKECVVVDCQWTLANAYRVTAEIIDSQLELKAIFATHSHPDHYWGMGYMQQAFPNAKCYMLPEDLHLYNHQYQAKLDEWEPIMGKNNLCRKQAENIIPLDTGYLELEGEKIEVFDHVMGDYRWNSVVWIPSIKTMYGSDVLFNQAHPFTCEVTAPQRAQWIRDIEKMEKYNAEVVIPGHQKEGCPFDGSAYKYTKDYLIATEEELASTKDSASFFYNMVKRFPGSSLIMYSNEMNAEVWKGGRPWNWVLDTVETPAINPLKG